MVLEVFFRLNQQQALSRFRAFFMNIRMAWNIFKAGLNRASVCYTKHDVK
jgi:hypothetical protein